MAFEDFIAKQKPAVIVVEGLIVLALIVFFVFNAFGGLEKMQEQTVLDQAAGDNIAKYMIQ